LPLAAWVANTLDPHMPRLEQNIETLVQRLPAPLLGVVPHLPRRRQRRRQSIWI